MNDMVERVAVALAGHRWDTFDDEHKNAGRDLARTAIEAMREPTERMRQAVIDDSVIQSGLDDCNQHDIPEKSWRLMIDAALS